MARKLTRDERINYEIGDNLMKYGAGDIRSQRGYCEAYVDGMIAVEEIQEKFKSNIQFEPQWLNGYRAGYSDGYKDRGQMMKGPV